MLIGEKGKFPTGCFTLLNKNNLYLELSLVICWPVIVRQCNIV